MNPKSKLTARCQSYVHHWEPPRIDHVVRDTYFNENVRKRPRDQRYITTSLEASTNRPHGQSIVPQ